MAFKDAGESCDDSLECTLTFPNLGAAIVASRQASAPSVPEGDGSAISGDFDLESILVATPVSSANEHDLENKTLSSSSERTLSESAVVDGPQAVAHAPVTVSSQVAALDAFAVASNQDPSPQSLARTQNSFEAFAAPVLPLPSDAHPSSNAPLFAAAALNTHSQEVLQVDFTVSTSLQAFTDRVRRANVIKDDDKRVDNDQDSVPTEADWLVLDAITKARVASAHSLFARESQFLTKLDFIQMQALPLPSSLASSGSLPSAAPVVPTAAAAAPVVPTAPPLVPQVPAPAVMVLRPVRWLFISKILPRATAGPQALERHGRKGPQNRKVDHR